MSRALWVAGFPSTYGGADTELDHLIDLLLAHGVEVHLVPMFGATGDMMDSVLARGCTVHDYSDSVFGGRTVASFCNGEFLSLLPRIMEAAPPARILWFNCMTWLFDAERAAHERGWIDLFGFNSRFQRSCLLPLLEEIRPVRAFDYRPYFNARRIYWSYREWEGTYRVGRISRDDGAKFAPDTWRIFDRVLVPPTLAKKVYVLGYGPKAEARIGPAPPGLDWRTWAPAEIPSRDFFDTIDTMIHKTGGSRESYGRVLVEAYAHGVVPVVENDFAFPELVVHGETGFLCDSSDEMSYWASHLAMNPALHRTMAENGRHHLEESVSEVAACWEAWDRVL